MDECVSPRRVPEALRANGCTVHTLKDTFGTGVDDIEWLPLVGSRGWVLLTKDKNIRRRRLELQALVDAGIKAFVLSAGNLRGEEQASVFVEALPAMLRLIARRPAPFLARVTASANVEEVDLDDWLSR